MTDSLYFQVTRPGDTAVKAATPLPVELTSGADATSHPVKFAAVNATADGVNSVIAAVASKKIRVIGYALIAAAAGLVIIQDDAGTPNVLGRFTFAANGGVSYSGGPSAPAFETAAGQALTLNNAAGVDVQGHITYIEV